eukprot:760251-Hanusia_phi.AAC.2
MSNLSVPSEVFPAVVAKVFPPVLAAETGLRINGKHNSDHQLPAASSSSVAVSSPSSAVALWPTGRESTKDPLTEQGREGKGHGRRGLRERR